MNDKKKALVVYSGGIDSTVLLYWALKHYDEVLALSFNYGAKLGDNELKCAKETCERLNVKHIICDISNIGKMLATSLTQDIEVPNGSWDSSLYVPFRNGIMISIAAGIAESNGIECVVLGSHKEPNLRTFDCPDGNVDFIEAMDKALQLGTAKHIRLVEPLMDIAKDEVIKLGNSLGVDFATTYSCYKGKTQHCGKCYTCIERKNAFKAANIPDPTTYEE